MTRREFHQLIDRLPERILDDEGSELVPTAEDIRELSEVVRELGAKLPALTRDWAARNRQSMSDGMDRTKWE